MIQLPKDFKEFLQLLNSNAVEYLLVGGYAVGYHGYPRSTGDMDIWIAMDTTNAEKCCRVLNVFGFEVEGLEPALFMETDRVIRMGVPPLRIELLTNVSGVEFRECFSRKIIAEIDCVSVPIIHLDDLRANKKAAGRIKDLNDLENLPE